MDYRELNIRSTDAYKQVYPRKFFFYIAQLRDCETVNAFSADLRP